MHVVIMYLITHLGLIFFTFPSNIMVSSSSGHWVPILLGVSIHLTVLAVFMKGMSFFGDRDMVSALIGVGKTVAVFTLVPVTVHFMLTVIVMIRSYSEIVDLVFLSNTPLWAITA